MLSFRHKLNERPGFRENKDVIWKKTHLINGLWTMDNLFNGQLTMDN